MPVWATLGARAPPARRTPAGLFNCSGGDIALGVILLLLLPVSFLAVSFYLVWRWLQHPGLNKRRAIFVLRMDPLADQIAAAATPAATPAASPGTSPREEGGAADGAAPSPGSAAAAAAAAVSSGADAAARARRWSFKGLVRSLCGARKLQGDWCAINLDSRFTFKYGPLFEATYGQVGRPPPPPSTTTPATVPAPSCPARQLVLTGGAVTGQPAQRGCGACPARTWEPQPGAFRHACSLRPARCDLPLWAGHGAAARDVPV